MGNKRRIDNKLIIRNQKEEKALGIDSLNLYAYMQGDELFLIGEIRANSIKEHFNFLCTAYDKDGDVIGSCGNSFYGGGGFVSSYIEPECFYDGFPFRINMNIPQKSKIAKIRLEPKR